MLNFLKQKKEPAPSEGPSSEGYFSRLKNGLAKTREHFVTGMANLILGKKTFDAESIEWIENQLLAADVGVDTTNTIIQQLTQQLARKELHNQEAIWQALQTHLKQALIPYQKAFSFENRKTPVVILMVGINGAGKTTTIGKLAQHFKTQGKKVLLAAGDTFRAAAIEQLTAWGERNQIPVIAQQPGADTAAVIYDALEAATARGIDILIADTAGRLHTQHHLMDELKKIKRVLAKLDPTAPHETLLVIDAGIGQNAMIQAKQFNEAIGLTGLALTKLDGTAKGGMIFSITKQLKLPIYFIGVGEGINDLQPFEADRFVDALFGK